MSDDLDLDDDDGAPTSDGKPRPNSQSSDETYGETSGELLQFFERIEQLNSEKADIAEQTKEVYAELKHRGFDGKAVRELIAERKKDREALSELAAIKALYRSALGMAALDDI